MKMQKNHSGFTLIELVVVITILGILAAVALPKFAALQANARVSKMEGAMGAVKSAATMAHAQLLASGLNANYSDSVSGPSGIVMEGTPVVYTNGYPDVATIVPLAGMISGDYSIAGGVISSDANHLGCSITYTPATSVVGPPVTYSPPTYATGASLTTCN